MLGFIKAINSLLWSGPLILLLSFTHIYFTVRSGFVQKHIFKAIRLSVKPAENVDGHSSTSPFAALATTLAATLGTGNIIGISTAIACGGPGAVFWCWLTGLFGMATTYAECYLGMKYRRKNEDGSFSGGPMYALEYGLGAKKTAVLFALSVMLVSCGMGCSTQSRSVTEALSTEFGISPFISGLVLAVVVGLAILGGIKSIGKICSVLVPVMSFFYLGGCIIILVINRAFLIDTVRIILEAAFLPRSIAGGLIGGSLLSAARYGVSRGLFTNEAGLGSAAIAAAAAHTGEKNQALVSMSATFWDTVVMCAITGIVIVSSLIRFPGIIDGYSYGELTTAAFTLLPGIGTLFLTLSLCAFAVATLIGWSFFGERAADYLGGQKGVKIYHVVYIVMIYCGSVMSLDYVWELSDLANALMLLPSLYALFRLRREVFI